MIDTWLCDLLVWVPYWVDVTASRVCGHFNMPCGVYVVGDGIKGNCVGDQRAGRADWSADEGYHIL